MSARRQTLRNLLLLCALGAVCASCTFIRNEFFVFDRPAPAADDLTGTDARW